MLVSFQHNIGMQLQNMADGWAVHTRDPTIHHPWPTDASLCVCIWHCYLMSVLYDCFVMLLYGEIDLNYILWWNTFYV